MKKTILKILLLFVLLIILTACEKKALNGTGSSEKIVDYSQSSDFDNIINSGADISSVADNDTVSGDDNVMTDIFSESENNISREDASDNSDVPENDSIISVPSDSEDNKGDIHSSDEWSKRY